jgi:hypothetical protein
MLISTNETTTCNTGSASVAPPSPLAADAEEEEADLSDTMPFPKELSGNSIMGSRDLKLYRQQSSFRFHEWRPWLRRAWICHFAASIVILTWGCMNNHGRKYIPVDTSTIDFTANCSKGFVNIFASSGDEDRARVCCGTTGDASTAPGDAYDGICGSPPAYLFLSRRLSRFPEAWLLPLFPLFLRAALHVMHQHRQLRQHGPPPTNQLAIFKAQNRLARRRFYFYVALIQVRGWILYLLFDQIEEYLVSPAANSDCWYERHLHPNYRSCQGQMTDFSDHVVLYFAQILPIPLCEVLHSFVVPFWKDRYFNSPSTNSHRIRSFLTASVVPIILICGMLYLYVIAFMGAYKTAVYFHTWPEIWNGYLVSMFIQVPLFMIQCTSLLDNATIYFFGFTSS